MFVLSISSDPDSLFFLYIPSDPEILNPCSSSLYLDSLFFSCSFLPSCLLLPYLRFSPSVLVSSHLGFFLSDIFVYVCRAAWIYFLCLFMCCLVADQGTQHCNLSPLRQILAFFFCGLHYNCCHSCSLSFAVAEK